MKQFLSVNDAPDLKGLVNKALAYKSNPLVDKQLGQGKTMGMLFLNPSMRTRLSTQLAAKNLGMDAIVFNVGAEGWALALGAAMRSAGVELFRYPSARDARTGVNAGVIVPSAFGAGKPHSLQTWACIANKARVEFTRRDYFAPAAFVFGREEFLVRGSLPTPAP